MKDYYKQYTAPEIVEAVAKIISHGNSAEIKKERDRIVVVEIERRVRVKSES